MSIENFRERLQVRTETIYGRMHEILTEPDTPAELKNLKLKRPEKVAFAALDIVGDEIGRAFKEAGVDSEKADTLNKRYQKISESPAKQSGQAKIDKLVEAVLRS